MPTGYLVTLLVALVAVLLTVWVSIAREKHKKKEHQKQFNPIVVHDKGKKRYFSWHSRDPIHLIENEGQDQQLLNFLVPVRDAIYENSDMKLQFSFPQDLKGEVVYEISSDFQSKWRLLGGSGDGPGDQVLVVLPPPHHRS